ncbi:MAG: esterase/lipase family protein [Methylophilaceae bacterium]
MQALFVHGMGRTPLSGWRLLRRLKQRGISTKTFSYFVSYEKFAGIKVRLVTELTIIAAEGEYIVIGHSLGGVILRGAINELPKDVRKPSHLFLVGSPVAASRMAKRFGKNALFRLATSDCGQLLGSDDRMSAIPPTDIPKTAIIGIFKRRINPMFSPEEKNDGIVSIDEVTAEWLNDRAEVEMLHSFLTSSKRVAEIILEKIKFLN